MNFIVTDREAVEQGLLVRQPYVLISICDPRKRSPRLPKSGLCGGILRLRFHDATPVAGFELPDEIKLMTVRQAKSIWRLIQQHKDEVDTVVVHCEAGMSRSPAVAAAICRGLGGDDAGFFREFLPNLYVYRLVLEAAPNSGPPAVKNPLGPS